jgi:hypothetical protein
MTVEPFRHVSAPLDTVMSRIIARSGETERQPRYVAQGRLIVSVHTGRRQTPPVARQALGFLIDSALAVVDDDLAESDIGMVGDLIRAIRQAERNDPLPPATIAQAA